jgi:hypothetical protein
MSPMKIKSVASVWQGRCPHGYTNRKGEPELEITCVLGDAPSTNRLNQVDSEQGAGNVSRSADCCAESAG